MHVIYIQIVWPLLTIYTITLVPKIHRTHTFSEYMFRILLTLPDTVVIVCLKKQKQHCTASGTMRYSFYTNCNLLFHSYAYVVFLSGLALGARNGGEEEEKKMAQSHINRSTERVHG